jgi:hypothetical protein
VTLIAQNTRLLKKNKECFDNLSMNGIFPIISDFPPFALCSLQQSLIAGFFSIELQRFHDRPVVDGKEDRFLVGQVLVRVPLP